ncbi:hypothetical protein LJB88_03660 [Erysipelotrichaceae bacterium OttesenSCG-928-M19]|nr:hypothetical protein [Erysipelotrichaceae bacterium OttesenSCG-928-M19]
MIINQDNFSSYFKFYFKEYYKVISNKVETNIHIAIHEIINEKTQKEIYLSFCEYAKKSDVDIEKITKSNLISFIKNYVISTAKSDDFQERKFILDSRQLKQGFIVYLTKEVYICKEDEILIKLIEVLYTLYGSRVTADHIKRIFDYNIKIVGIDISIEELKYKLEKYYRNKEKMDNRLKFSQKRDYFNMIEFKKNYN